MFRIDFQLDKDSTVPLYLQLLERLRKKILSGEYPDGSKLPSVREIEQLLGVSKNVVIKAMDELYMDDLVYREVGSGTYIRAKKEKGADPGPIDWCRHLDTWYRHTHQFKKRSPSSETATRGLQVIFHNASPDDELIPDQLLKALTQRAMKNPLFSETVNYVEHPKGLRDLRKAICMRLGCNGESLKPENVIVSGRNVESEYLIFKAFTRQGESVVVENPTNMSVLGILKTLHLKVIPVRSSIEGMDLKELEDVLRKNAIKLIYMQSTAGEPMGFNMPEKKKRDLVKLAANYKVPIIDDLTGGSEFQYSGKTPFPIRHYEEDNVVFEIHDIVKTFGAGVTTGWIVGPEKALDILWSSMRVIERDVAGLLQLVTNEILNSEFYDHHLSFVQEKLAKRRELLIHACNRYLPSYAKANICDSGTSWWVELPKGFDLREIRKNLNRKNIEIAPGNWFFNDEKGYNFFRLGLYVKEEYIEPALIEIGKTIERYRKHEFGSVKKFEYVSW